MYKSSLKFSLGATNDNHKWWKGKFWRYIPKLTLF